RQRATERVQTEHGLRARDQLHGADGRQGNQVPIDRVAEGLVDAYAVLVHSKSLRQPEERRCRESAKVEVRLQRIVLRMIDVDAREVTIQVVGEIQRLRALELAGRRSLYVCRDERRIDASAVRRGDDDFLERRTLA